MEKIEYTEREQLIIDLFSSRIKALQDRIDLLEYMIEQNKQSGNKILDIYESRHGSIVIETERTLFK